MTLSNAYSAYLAAKNSGWDLVASFHARVGSTHPEVVAREDNLSLDEVRLLLRVHNRIKPGALGGIQAQAIPRSPQAGIDCHEQGR